MPTITAFESSPDGGRGLARDFPVRWALEEVGQRYDVRLLSFAQMKEPAHLALQPFGQIPTYEEGDLALFESAAIILHIAETNHGLLPADPAGRARAIAWMFAAKSSVEPTVTEREAFILFEKAKPWFDERLPILDGRVRSRLEQLSGYLGDREWLEGAFSAGDLLMVNVLRRPAAAALLSDYPNLARYVERGEARPAFKRAFEAQLAVFEASKAA
jgi:glutathione S-transferase